MRGTAAGTSYGCEAAGIDFSGKSLEIARQKSPDIDFYQKDNEWHRHHTVKLLVNRIKFLYNKGACRKVQQLRRKNMDAKLESWLEEEMKEFSEVLQTFKKKQKNKAPIWMAASLAGMVALGFIVGYDISYVMRVHFPIGCGIALFAGLCFWLPSKISNIKGVRKAYEKGMQDFFQTEEDRELFVRQMESGNYGKVNFYNVSEETYPGRFIAGPDYWMYYNRACRFVRTDDILSLSRQNESTRVTYDTGGGRRGKNIAIGVSLVVKYKEGSASAKANRDAEESFFFSKSEQYQEVMELIKAHCPQYQSWAGDRREG